MDNVSPARSECDELLNAQLPFAMQMLEKYGEFFPFGAVLLATGEIQSVAVYEGHERPPSADVIRSLKHVFIQGAKSGEYKATVLIYDARITLPSSGKKSDAIAVLLDHRENYSAVVYFPYHLQNGHVLLGEAFAERKEGDVFSGFSANSKSG